MNLHRGIQTYYYNAYDQRIIKTADSGSTVFVYDRSGRLLGEYKDNGDYQEHIWLGDMPIGVVRKTTPTQPLYVLSDQLGAPRALVDGQRDAVSKGLVVWRWEGEAFGSSVAEDNPDGDATRITYNLRFPGQYYDAESGKRYNYFRDYDPGLGRYLESGPIELADGVNTYGNVRGGPVRVIDPLGQAGFLSSAVGAAHFRGRIY